MDIIQITSNRPSIKPDIIFNLLGFPVTNSILMALLITLIILIFSYFIFKKVSVFPKKWQIIVEAIYEFCYDLVDKITGSSAITKKIFYLIASLFVFIAMSNVLGIFLPFLGSFTYKEVPIFRTPTTDFNVTLSLALSMIIIIQVSSIKKWGILKYIGGFFKFHEIFNGFKKGIGSGLMGIVNFMIGLLDIISEFAKIISLSMRLFGNMFAGETLAIVLLGFLAYILPSVWMTMNIFIGFVQAIVFGALTAAYYSLAVKGAGID
jgi:F-type H+-transporting ATPase subunit a